VHRPSRFRPRQYTYIRYPLQVNEIYYFLHHFHIRPIMYFVLFAGQYTSHTVRTLLYGVTDKRPNIETTFYRHDVIVYVLCVMCYIYIYIVRSSVISHSGEREGSFSLLKRLLFHFYVYYFASENLQKSCPNIRTTVVIGIIFVSSYTYMQVTNIVMARDRFYFDNDKTSIVRLLYLENASLFVSSLKTIISIHIYRTWNCIITFHYK